MGLGLGLGASSSSYTSEYLPTEIDSLEIWLSTDTLNTLDTVDSTTREVQKWTNRANAGYDFKFIGANRGPIANVARTEIVFTGTTNGDSLVGKDASGNTIEAELSYGDGYTICIIATNEAMDSGSVFAGSAVGNNSALTFFDTDALQFKTNAGTENFTTDSLNDDTFVSYIIVVSSDLSNNATLFINNNEASSLTIDGDFNFGQLGGNNGNSLNNSFTRMKQVIVYSKALNEVERNALYTNYIAPAI
tara:strand:- start:277 stop:1020 length:744 start_codon:yes stop_codon:yes gene_type:complete